MIKEEKFITDGEIERKAYALLNGFEAQFGKVVNPIPIDRIIESYLNLWIDWDEIEDTDEEKILGLLNPSSKKIQLNERHRDHFEEYIGTEAYTKAHEVGHWDIHIIKEDDTFQLPLLTLPNGQPYLCRQQKYDRREIQAEKYAAYLLMPHHLVMNAIKNVDITEWRTLYNLKDSFGVTITAFKKRLEGLGLIYVTDDKKIFHSKVEALGAKSMF